MPIFDRDAVSIYYEVTGPEGGRPVVLIHGNGAQMIAWYPGFVDLLEQAGCRVIRFDNRDVGLSTKLPDTPYALADMVRDVVALLDHLGLASAHIVGQSMGGMIAQQLTIDHPDRVRSLVSIYSAPSREFLAHDEEAVRVRAAPPAVGRDAAIAQYIERERISGLDGFTEEEILDLAARVVDRDWTPEGGVRQGAALRDAPDRRPGLAGVTVPAAVIHGRDDRLVSFEGGIATALAIPGSELHVFAGMGHQVAPRYWRDIVRIIVRTADRAVEATP